MSRAEKRRNERQMKKYASKIAKNFDWRRARRDTDLLAAIRTIINHERKSK